MAEIQETLNLTDDDVWVSSIAAVSGSVLVRLVVGPLCDKYGARLLICTLLCIGSTAAALTGIINGAMDLIVLRMFLGISGGVFIVSQYWTSRMFTHEVVGTANSLVAGWGNLGTVIAQFVIGIYLFPLFKSMAGGNAEVAWRAVCVVPATVGFITAGMVYFYSDDAPKGNYNEMKQNRIMPNVSARRSLNRASRSLNTWILAFQYACCFGVEMTMVNSSARYFAEIFQQNPASASALAAVFGWMNLFARGLGGYVSDKLNAHYGLRGRLVAQVVFLLAEALFILLFSQTRSLGLAFALLIPFSVFVQASEGSTFSIVPYVDPPSTGSVCGIVGAGGSVGGVLFIYLFGTASYRAAFTVMSIVVFVSAFFSCGFHIKEYGSLLLGEVEEAEIAERLDTTYQPETPIVTEVHVEETQI